MAPQYHAFSCAVAGMGGVAGRCVVASGALGALGEAALREAVLDLRGGTRYACVPRSAHQFWDHDLEPAAVFAPGMGLALHPGLDADGNRPRAAACRMVLPGA